MKVSIGRIVHYFPTKMEKDFMKACRNCNVSEILAAIVVSISGEDGDNDRLINLKVILDGNTKDLWIKHVHQGNNEGEWNWPVIV